MPRVVASCSVCHRGIRIVPGKWRVTNIASLGVAIVKDCFAAVLLPDRLSALSSADAICDSCRRSVYRFKSKQERPTTTSVGPFGASGMRLDYHKRAAVKERVLPAPGREKSVDQDGAASGDYLKSQS